MLENKKNKQVLEELLNEKDRIEDEMIELGD